MRILLTGASGQLGTELRLVLPDLGEVLSTDVVPPLNDCPEFQSMDFCDPKKVLSILESVHPDIIVNAAAYTQVDKAESDTNLAMRINAEAPALLAGWANENDALVMHYSTDYVFDGKSKKAYLETDSPAPINAYGISKLAGERAIAQSGCRHLILRTSWIYSSHGTNFLLTMLRLAEERSHLSVVNDQFGCPTWARNLAHVSKIAMAKHIESLNGSPAQSPLTGLYHYCDRPPCTWYDFANLIFEAAVAEGLLAKAPQLDAVTSDQFQTAAKRPEHSVLATLKIEKALRIESANVRASVWACLQEISEGN